MSTRNRLRVLATIAVCLCAYMGWAATIASPPRRAKLHVDFLDVGHGDSTLITSPSGKTVLIDGGLADAGPGILSFLGGLVHVIESCGARLYLDAPYPHESNIYGKLLRVLESRQVPVRQAERGRIIELGDGARLLLLGPPSPIIEGADSDVNANSVVSRLDYGNGSVLFAADAEELAERWLLESGANLRATVLKVGHHGSRHSSTIGFLNAVTPLAAVISTEADDAKHPHPEMLARLAQVGTQVFRTDLDGTIAVEMDGARVTVRGRGRAEVFKTP